MTEKFNIDGDAVRSLARLLDETDLSEIEYQVGTQRVRVCRNGGQVMMTAAPAPVAASPIITPAPTQPAPAQIAAPQATQGEKITSPMVGTAYLAPEPGAAPFIKPGDMINEGDVMLIIEAMKVMNPIKATKSGKVLEILVSDGAPVEYGEPLITLG